MHPFRRPCRAGLAVLAAAIFVTTTLASQAAAKLAPAPVQATGFLNRTLEIQGVPYKFQVYLPEDYKRQGSDAKSTAILGKPLRKWPIILFLHGRGERGSEGMWQTQIGLPQQVRDHPERWPFIIVMPQCPQRHFWTDPDMLEMALASLDQEQREFQADPDRTYLVGLSLGGYGAWELARDYPHRWAAIALASTGIFWSYAPDRWRESTTLPAEYAHRLGRTPVWLFHGSDDTTVIPRQSELMFDALKAENGHVRLWVYQGLKHDCWTRAFNEPELPRWLLSHHLNAQGQPVHTAQPGQPTSTETPLPPLAERLTIPLHPPAIKLPPSLLDSYVGEYRDSSNVLVATIQRQGEQIFLRNGQGDVSEIEAESASTFFYPTGSLTRLTFEHDPQGRVTAILYHDDRHDERWEKKR